MPLQKQALNELQPASFCTTSPVIGVSMMLSLDVIAIKQTIAHFMQTRIMQLNDFKNDIKTYLLSLFLNLIICIVFLYCHNITLFCLSFCAVFIITDV